MTGAIAGTLVLADGTTFRGELVGAAPADKIVTGHLVFHTAPSGYYEAITDPCCTGLLVAFTYPHIGNVGVTASDARSSRIQSAGLIVRDLARRASNFRSEGSLADAMERDGISGITGVDTRKLARVIRSTGPQTAAFGAVSVEELRLAAAQPSPHAPPNVIGEQIPVLRPSTCDTEKD